MSRAREQMAYSGQPAYLRIADDLRVQILGGRLSVGAQLPAIPELERKYGVSMSVIRKAVALLQDEGLVRTYQGKGTYVESAEPLTTERGVAADTDLAHHLQMIYRELTAINDRLARLESRGSER